VRNFRTANCVRTGMRQQSIWLKVLALFALVVLVLPASAQVVFCATHPAMQKCCKAKEPVQKVEAIKSESCCAGEAKLVSEIPSQGISSGTDEQCKCFWDSAPTQPNQDLTPTAFFAPPMVAEEPIALPVKVAVPACEPSLELQRILFTDSSPPRHAYCASHAGRAPPVL
jgi:hypothetical protein